MHQLHNRKLCQFSLFVVHYLSQAPVTPGATAAPPASPQPPASAFKTPGTALRGPVARRLREEAGWWWHCMREIAAIMSQHAAPRGTKPSTVLFRSVQH